MEEYEIKCVLSKLMDSVCPEVNNNPITTNGTSKKENHDYKIEESINATKESKQKVTTCPIQEQKLINSEKIISDTKPLESQQQAIYNNKQKIDEVSSIITNNASNKPPSINDRPKEIPILANNDILETDETKDMVVLRNLEISPPPPNVTTAPAQLQLQDIINDEDKKDSNNKEKINERNSELDDHKTPSKKATSTRKRRLAQPNTSENEGTNNEQTDTGRSKRQRTQTKLFQAGDSKSAVTDPFGSSSDSPSPIKTNRQSRANRGRKKSTTSSNCSEINISYNAQDIVDERQNLITHDLQDVIFYEKNDYLAIRNEENTFYLCQLTENVKSMRPMIKVKWLDTNDDGKTYFLTAHYDKIPHKSIIMPISLNKLKSEKKGEQIFSLDEQDRENIMERLRRSVNASQHHLNSSQESNVTEITESIQ